jgi:SAM-dependent methyltransferase
MRSTITTPRSRIAVAASQQDLCPACEQGRLEVFFEIAQAPILCNILCPTREAALSVPRGAIRLGFCRKCGHVYNVAFDPKRMQYNGAYENSLQFSPRFQSYIESLAGKLVKRYQLRDKNIIEIGCGQGDFLSLLCAVGGNAGIGFDPSFDPGKTSTALAGRVQIRPQLYSPEHAKHPADLLCCRHVLEHIPRPLEFLRQIRQTIGDRSNGVVFFEVPNALFTLKRRAIWDIIYEHCSYFTPASLRSVFELAGFEVLSVQGAYHGQFLTIEARPTRSEPWDASLATEEIAEFARRFEEEYRSKFVLWRRRLDRISKEERRAVIWGGGSKGVTFLNVLQVAHDVIPYAVDLNPRKHGHFIAGTAQAIVPPTFLAREYPPDEVVVMNRIYKDEIGRTLADLGLHATLSVAG